ncbi:hypothetical protein K440DRAFT_641905 [Wilcoxina mikolae CBS 423.85]|nr:hypothetical protein K440DRAFT_641905 [Wilcoxina mikolae CBS 423.85]
MFEAVDLESDDDIQRYINKQFQNTFDIRGVAEFLETERRDKEITIITCHHYTSLPSKDIVVIHVALFSHNLRRPGPVILKAAATDTTTSSSSADVDTAIASAGSHSILWRQSRTLTVLLRIDYIARMANGDWPGTSASWERVKVTTIRNPVVHQLRSEGGACSENSSVLNVPRWAQYASGI